MLHAFFTDPAGDQPKEVAVCLRYDRAQAHLEAFYVEARTMAQLRDSAGTGGLGLVCTRDSLPFKQWSESCAGDVDAPALPRKAQGEPGP